MSDSETLRVLFDWADKLVRCQRDVLQQFRFLTHGLRTYRPAAGEYFSPNGMSDLPRSLHVRLENLRTTLAAAPEDISSWIPYLESLAVSESPIRCEGYFVLTALEAAPVWAEQVWKSVAPIEDDLLDPCGEPAWPFTGFSYDQYMRCQETCRSIVKELRPITDEKLLWLEAKLRAEWNRVIVETSSGNAEYDAKEVRPSASQADQERLAFYTEQKAINPRITHAAVARLWHLKTKEPCDETTMKQSVYRARKAVNGA